MEATEIINPNGDIERTIVLNEEESNQILNNIAPEQRETVMQHLNRIAQNTPQISAEELERICDEAVGIVTTQTMDNIYPSDSVGIAPTEIQSEHDVVEEVEDITEITEEALEHFEEEVSTSEESTSVEEEPTQTVEEPVASAPVVYNTQLNSVTTTRFSGAEWFDKIHEQNIIVGGAGGISSWLAFLLARTNVGEITIYDNDKVEAVNLAGQFFGVHDVGMAKVYAVTNHIREFADYYTLNYKDIRYDEYCKVSDVMMCGFDNMEARKTYFLSWKRHLLRVSDKSKCLLIDGRLKKC